MNAIKKRYFRNIGLVWLGCILLFLAFGLLMLGPQRQAIGKSRAELEKVKNEFEEITKMSQQASVDKAEKEVADLKSKLDRFCVDFTNSSNLTLDISRIAKDKKANSFVINANKAKAEAKLTGGEKIIENNLEVSYTANNFKQFASFISALERHNPLVFVDGFSITRAEQSGQGHEVTMNLSYFVKKSEIK